jgi:hypothetical protein
VQIFITYNIKALVTPFTVEEMRELYDEYERHMYTNVTYYEHYEGIKTQRTHYRGVDGTFDISKFDLMTNTEKREVCQIPLTQPTFLFCVLLIWSLTCVYYLRSNVLLTYRLVCATETIDDMANALSKEEGGSSDAEDHVGKPKTVDGLTCAVKVFITMTIQIPQFLMIVYLMWLGCRWLTATLGFGEVVLNAIALEFVLGLHVLVYRAIVPLTMDLEIKATSIPVEPSVSRRQRLGCMNMFASFSVLVICIIWCLVYLFVLETVLPGYKWDVKQACELHEPKQFSFFD